MVEPSIRFGSFANAFRVVDEVGPDCFLDFLVYSAAEREATVVARIRVRRDFLGAIRERLAEAMLEFNGEQIAAETSIAFRQGGDSAVRDRSCG
jgi:hypothetical protein